MLKRCCYERVTSLSISKTLPRIQENNFFLTIDNIVTAEKGWERGRRKRRIRTNYYNLTTQETLLPKLLLLGLMHRIRPDIQTNSSYSLQDSHLKMLLEYEYSQIFWYMSILLMEIWLLLLQPDFMTFRSFLRADFAGWCWQLSKLLQLVIIHLSEIFENTTFQLK